jgi:hypothetical protein
MLQTTGTTMTKQKQGSGNPVQGEGSYTGARRYNEHVKKHAETADVEELARQAREALEGDEKAELEAAEQKGKSGPRPNSGQKEH